MLWPELARRSEKCVGPVFMSSDAVIETILEINIMIHLLDSACMWVNWPKLLLLLLCEDELTSSAATDNEWHHLLN